MRIHFIALAAGLLAACQSTGPRPDTAAVPPAVQDGCRPGETALACDRRAILGMAGEYAVSFAFDEVTALRPGYELKKPKRSGAREWVQLIEDRGDFLSLQHILVDGEGHVTKHWRQDWRYQPEFLWNFTGHKTWTKHALAAGEARGAWSQTVYEVDDSPRYTGLGRWRHDGNVAAWTSESSWRPLPRREYTTRSDYDVMVAVNRQEIAPNGWVHTQDNLKLDTRAEAGTRYIAREEGANRYVKLAGHDFGPGKAYWSKTAPFWAEVRAAWARRFETAEHIAIREKIEGKPLWQAMFELAENPPAGAEAGARIEAVLSRYVSTGPEPRLSQR
ncbi:MAG: hypothetical protein HYV16_13195 [Gammaproteobacteria bacterium]|nr:hypothetical protein [Gammaproteobacteria bacterium]